MHRRFRFRLGGSDANVVSAPFVNGQRRDSILASPVALSLSQNEDFLEN